MAKIEFKEVKIDEETHRKSKFICFGMFIFGYVVL